MNGIQASSGSVSASPHPLQGHDEFGEIPLTARLIKDSSRIDVDSLMNEFRRELGPSKWEKYRDSLTHFLMGKLSRAELVKCLKENLGLSGYAMRNHNTLVLSLLANACREAPPGTESSLAEWKATTRGGKARHTQIDSTNDRMHKEILSLPVRERRRIKNIAKESAAALKAPLILPQPPVLVATRQAMLPHIPFHQDSSKESRNSSPMLNAGTTSQAQNGERSLKEQVRNTTGRGKDKDNSPSGTGSSLLTDPLLGLHSGRTSGPLTWTQDIIQGFDTPLISESHEVPDDFALGSRMLGIALEHGVLGGIGTGATDMMLVGLETYLSNIVDRLIAVKHRRISGQDPLGASDLSLLAELSPSEMGDIAAPLFRLSTTVLQDEESVVPQARKLNPLKRNQESSASTPLDLYNMRKASLESEEDKAAQQAALEEHEKGIEVLSQLLS